MQRSAIVEQLKNYIVERVLEGRDIGIDETTPLLEWGIINSLETMRLLSFIERQFGIEIPMDNLVADHFTNLTALTNLIMALAEPQKAAEQPETI
jgi:acyl carrier protein